ncbi:vacuolar calcium ion transporter /H(+) exchanger [Hyaloscypha bicolor E]|uniref:Vacuolar calcium ion transporter n=1 Tax=Hyaloscypha bicolor E TaxID=1095630 RepID=A0A2J6TJL6_9HELO|nr:vacuolar calcium ion transporter /H(+) exchanger [Hyaloscypha bicolor E]PMD63219.1 vacuolar calcium ion transporter /H(+) exchanger [Hyaloscypha bicolor E]
MFINILVVFVPLGIVAGIFTWAPRVVFIFNILALLPLAKLLSSTLTATSERLYPLLGIVLKATIGNSVLLIVSIIALATNHTQVVQSSMLGSILANTLLVVGFCFLIAGIRHRESVINTTFTSTASSMMYVASASLVIPAALFGTQCRANSSCEQSIIKLSRGIAVILLVLFVVYLNFRFNSHADLFEGRPVQRGDRQEEVEQSSSLVADGVVILLCMPLTAAAAFFLMGASDSITESSPMSSRLLGLVLLPLVAEGPERVAAMTDAYQNRMDHALDFAIGRSMQIALFVTPLLVLLGWAMHISEPMTLQFQPFETVALFLGVLMVTNLIGDGKSNYLEGAICLATYVIIALAFQFLP